MRRSYRPNWPEARRFGTATIAGHPVPLYDPPSEHMAPEPWACLTALRAVVGPGSYPVIERGTGLQRMKSEAGEIDVASPRACVAAASLARHAGAITAEIETEIRKAMGEEPLP